ncbi:MAG TPA: MFS transporter [Gemmatimonadales bacterium]|jgi:MFS family permease
MGHRNFRIFFSGYIVSLVGIWMHRVGQQWLVLELTDSALWVGAVDALGSMPILFFSLYAGALADRISRYRMVIATQIAAMALSLILAVLVLAGVVQLWQVVGVATLLGVVTAFDIPARQSFFVELVGKDDLLNAIALNSSAFNASRVVGPAIGGVVIVVLGVGMCFLINGVTYLAVVAALFAMTIPSRAAPLPGPPAWVRIREGLAYVAEEPRVRAIVLNLAGVSIFGFPSLVLLPVVARNVLGGGAQAYGWMVSAVGAGAVVSALVLAAYARRIPKGRVLGLATATFGILAVLLGLSRTLGVMLVLLVLAGLAMIVTTATTNSLLQTIAPDELRGRVVSIFTVAFGGMTPFGALQAGFIAEHLGVMTAFLTGGTVTVLLGVRTMLRRDLRLTT